MCIVPIVPCYVVQTEVVTDVHDPLRCQLDVPQINYSMMVEELHDIALLLPLSQLISARCTRMMRSRSCY